MTTFTHQLLSRKTSMPEVWQCECEYSSRSATVSVVVLRMGYAEVAFIQPGGKLDNIVTWCLATTSYSTSRWDVAVTYHCSRTVLPLTPPETQKLAAWGPSVHQAKYFVHRIARIWTRLTCHLQCSSADGTPSSKFLLSWQNVESDCQMHGRNYTAWRSHCQFVTFITFIFAVNVIGQMAPLFSKVDSNTLRHDVQNEETVTCAKFGKDRFSISKV